MTDLSKTKSEEKKQECPSPARSTYDTEYLLKKELTKIKAAYEPSNIYIFECNKCANLIMLHNENCFNCKAKNYYYDETLKIDPLSEGQAKSALDRYEEMKENPSLIPTSLASSPVRNRTENSPLSEKNNIINT